MGGENTVTNMIRYSNKLDWSLFLSVLVDIIDFPIKSTIRRIKTGLKFNINFFGNTYYARNSMELEWHLCFQVLTCLEFQLSNPWLFIVLKLQTSEPSQKFRVKSSAAYLLIWHTKLAIVLDFDPKMLSFKTTKRQCLLLIWNSSQCGTWKYLGMKMFMKFHGIFQRNICVDVDL